MPFLAWQKTLCCQVLAATDEWIDVYSSCPVACSARQHLCNDFLAPFVPPLDLGHVLYAEHNGTKL